jgi:hypothetical protein
VNVPPYSITLISPTGQEWSRRSEQRSSRRPGAVVTVDRTGGTFVAVFTGLGYSSKTALPVVAVYAVDDEADARRWRPRWVMANTSEMGEK